jgi:hypothetical protein
MAWEMTGSHLEIPKLWARPSGGKVMARAYKSTPANQCKLVHGRWENART